MSCVLAFVSSVTAFLLVLSSPTLAIATRSQQIGKNVTSANEIKIVKIEMSDAIERHPIVEGDIVGPMPKMGRSGIIDPNARWPSNTVVYEFDPNFPESFRTTFAKAMTHIAGRTCVAFKERMAETDYVFVTQGLDCSSSVGKRGGRQVLSLGSQCGSELAVHVHLLVHAIGFGHEHNRADRNEYITINYANIDPINHANFDTYPAAAYSPFSVPYDYNSITHYGPKVQSANGQDSITPKQVGAVIGEGKGLSELDIKKINNMYCIGSLGVMIRSVYDGSYLDVKGGVAGEGKDVVLSKLKDQDSQKWTANWVSLMDPSKGSTFATWAQDGGRLKVLDEDEVTGNIATWGYASGFRNQLWSIEEMIVTGTTSVQKRYRIKNFATSRCLSSPTVRCVGLNLFEFFFKKLVYNNCRGGQARTVTCKDNDSKQLWNIDFV